MKLHYFLRLKKAKRCISHVLFRHVNFYMAASCIIRGDFVIRTAIFELSIACRGDYLFRGHWSRIWPTQQVGNKFQSKSDIYNTEIKGFEKALAVISICSLHFCYFKLLQQKVLLNRPKGIWSRQITGIRETHQQ
jgi:hypothetical protein